MESGVARAPQIELGEADLIWIMVSRGDYPNKVLLQSGEILYEIVQFTQIFSKLFMNDDLLTNAVDY